MTVVLIELPGPDAFDGVTEYDVFTEGAVMLTEQDVDEIPPLHAHEVSGLPLPQVAVSVTDVPAWTAAELVLGDWDTTQLEGVAGGGGGVELPTYTVVLKGVPLPALFVGVTV